MNRTQIALSGLATVVVVVLVVVVLKWGIGSSGPSPSGMPDGVAPGVVGEHPGTDDILATVRRGGGAPSEAGPAGERSERQPLAEARPERVERIGRLLARASSDDEKLALLVELEGVRGPALVDLLMREMDGASSDVKMAILAMLTDIGDQSVLPAVDKSLADQDPEVRAAAVEVLAAVDRSRVCVPLLARALTDDSAHVRDAAFAVLDDKPAEDQYVVFAESINSPHKDVRERTVDMISYHPSHRALEILMQGLKDSDPEIVEDVKWQLDYFVAEEFESYDQAAAWWQNNNHRFDEELFEK